VVCPFLLRLNINSPLSDQPQNQQPVNFSTSNNLKSARSAHHNSEFGIQNFGAAFGGLFQMTGRLRGLPVFVEIKN